VYWGDDEFREGERKKGRKQITYNHEIIAPRD
jgi:hypothetical protein